MMTVRLRKGTKIKVPQEMVDEIRQHVNNSWMYYPNPTNRTEHEIKNHIFQGKLTEVGYYLLCIREGINNISKPDLLTHKNFDDGGYDFTQNNKTVDVKSLDAFKPGYYKMPVKPALRAEAYVLCWVNVNIYEVKYEGAITSNTIKMQNLLCEDVNEKGQIYYYVNKCDLRDLDENFE